MATDQKKTICLITDTYWPVNGGVESWVHAYSIHLKKYFTVKIIAHANTSCLKGMLSRTIFLKPFKPYNDDANNTVSPLYPSFLGRIILIPFIVWTLPFVKRFVAKPLFDYLYRFYKKAFFTTFSATIKNASLVHCFSTSHLAICATDICISLKIPIVQSPPVHFGKWGDSPLLLQSYSKANALVCLSQSFKTEYKKLMSSKNQLIFVIPPLMTEDLNPVEIVGIPSKPFILFLGRRESHKGLTKLYKAFSSLSVNVLLVIAGPGNSTGNTSESIIDLGEVTDGQKQWLLEQCAVLCVPSQDESFGIVYIEAMKQAKPVVAFNIAPVNEIVGHTTTGLLVEPGNIDHLTIALESVLTDDTLKETLGNNGQVRYKEKYATSVVLENILQVYNSLM